MYNILSTIIIIILLSIIDDKGASDITHEDGILETRGLEAKKAISSGPYCGIYCMYAAALYFDHEIKYSNLFHAKYVDMLKGSSLSQLSLIADDYGLITRRIDNCDFEMLAIKNTVAVLHVKSNKLNNIYDHYVLCMDMQDDKYIIIDPPYKVSLLSKHEIKEIWDKKALIISDNSQIDSEIRITAISKIIHMLLYIVVAFATIQCIIMILDRRRDSAVCDQRGMSVWVIIVLVGGGSVWGLVYSVFHPQGMLFDRQYAVAVYGKYIGNQIRYIENYEEMQDIIRAYNPTIIDVRSERDYNKMHIEGAVNIPYYSKQTDIINKLNNIYMNNADIKTILYCKSSRCEYSRTMARRFMRIGYENIYIYYGGIDDWIAKKRENKESTQ